MAVWEGDNTTERNWSSVNCVSTFYRCVKHADVRSEVCQPLWFLPRSQTSFRCEGSHVSHRHWFCKGSTLVIMFADDVVMFFWVSPTGGTLVRTKVCQLVHNSVSVYRAHGNPMCAELVQSRLSGLTAWVNFFCNKLLRNKLLSPNWFLTQRRSQNSFFGIWATSALCIPVSIETLLIIITLFL